MIRFTFKYLKPVAFFLSVVVLFQCCKIYDKRPVTIDHAINETRVKIITTDDRKYVFDNIYYKSDSLLYGIMRKNKSFTEEIIIPIETIKEIHLYNRKKSITATVFLAIGSGWAIALLVAFIVMIVDIINTEGN
jgi:hypothetical protein